MIKTKIFKIVLFLALIIMSIVLIFQIIGDEKESRLSEETKTTSTIESAQSNFSEGDEKTVNDSLNKGSASVSDAEGAIESNNALDESSWITSNSGEITLYEPTTNSLLSSGNTISGESTLETVQFRIIDDVSGVILQGQLKVINGKFSGIVTYDTSAENGRLDIFGIRNDASEFSNIEVLIALN